MSSKKYQDTMTTNIAFGIKQLQKVGIDCSEDGENSFLSTLKNVTGKCFLLTMPIKKCFSTKS